MFGFLSDIKDAISTVGDLIDAFGVFLKFGVLGMVACAVAYFAGRLVAKWFGEFAALAFVLAVGLGIVGGANALDYFKDAQALHAQAKVAKLEAENKAKDAKIDELRVTNAELTDFLDEQSIAAQGNAETLARINAKLAAQEDRPDCAIPKDILDELDNLR